MASKKKSKSNKKAGVEPFEDDINDEVQEDDEMANKVKESRRRRIEAEAEEDAVEDDDEDEDEAEEEAEPVDLGFAPFIIHDDADWTLEDAIDGAEPGENLYFFRPPPDDETPAKWYKLQAIEVGEK